MVGACSEWVTVPAIPDVFPRNAVGLRRDLAESRTLVVARNLKLVNAN